MSLFDNLEEMSQDQIIETMTNVMESEMWPYFKFLFDSKLSNDNVRVNYLRTIVKTGWPLQINGVTYQTYSDDPEELQEEYFKDFIWMLEENLIEKFEDSFP